MVLTRNTSIHGLLTLGSLVKFELDKCKHFFIWGGGHGIGLALVKVLIARFPEAKVFASYRDEQKSKELIDLSSSLKDRLEVFRVDPVNESELFDLAVDLKSLHIEIDLFINCIGFLHNEDFQPEKSLRSVSMDQFLELFKVNTVVTALIAKHFERLLPTKSPSAFICLSARVGSIGDNKMGGWYSYRASKAALNMILQNIAVEFKRKRLQCLVAPIHPGTTKTDLSAPFIVNTKYRLHEPEDSAFNILNQIDKRSIEETGSFLSWDGESIAW